MIQLILTEDERKALLEAVEQVEAEYGFHVGEVPPPPLHQHTRFDPCEVCDKDLLRAHRRKVEDAARRGRNLIHYLERIGK